MLKPLFGDIVNKQPLFREHRDYREQNLSLNYTVYKEFRVVVLFYDRGQRPFGVNVQEVFLFQIGDHTTKSHK